ncbi:MAG: GTP-binding protein [Promethearchaeota archaeon]|nr:MAG: GTP-binding protein [Candidatus Lokiarchaeota archaeon]
MYDATFKIILFGDPGCGKSTLVKRFLTNLFIKTNTYSLGVSFEVKSLTVDGQQVKLQIWSFKGQESYKFLLPTYIRAVRGAIFMYDITNYASLAHLNDWLEVIRKEISAEDIFPIIVVGGKADLAENREVPADDAIKITKSRGLDAFIECSAKTGENVEEAFIALTRLMLDHSESRQNAVETGEAHLSELGSLKGALNDINIDLEQIKNRFAWKTYPYSPKPPKPPENLNDLLKKLLSAIPEVNAAALVSTEGLPILAALPREVDETKFAAMTAALCSIAKNAISTIQNGDFNQLYITSSNGIS